MRQVTEDPISEDVLDKILKAALRAQSSKNTQPWQPIVIRERQALIELSKLGWGTSRGRRMARRLAEHPGG